MAQNKDTELLAAYLVVGDDLLKRERVLKRLRMRLERLGDLAFNSDRFDASASADEIVTACRTVPFASEKRLVVVEEANRLSKKEVKVIAEYLSDPAPTTVLILICDTLPQTSPLMKAVAALGRQAVISCLAPKRRDLPSQVSNMARTHGIALTPDAAAVLVELIGENTVHIDEELKKLALANPKRTEDVPLDAAEVRESVAHVSEFKPWDFVDAFANRDIATCVHMRSHMASTSSHVLLRQCVNRIRELVCAKTLSQEGGDVRSKVASALSLPPKRAFVAKYRIDQAARFSSAELAAALISSVATERAMKSGADPDLVFEEWAVQVMGR